jgi:starch synthase
MVTRLTAQKGIDLVIDAADALVGMGLQIAVVGTGERDLVDRLEAVARRHPENFAVFIGFDESLAHLVEAGADMFLMPSRFEPCGMNQMYSQRYGTPPIGRNTGGLADTITDGETGFLIEEATVPGLIDGVGRGIAALCNPSQFKRMQANGMIRDFSWENSARAYSLIYERIKPTS